MANTTLIASVTGIAVSGVVGPTLTAWAARRAQRQQFNRDQRARRRDDLRTLFDEAASLLGLGATRLRQTREAELAQTPLAEQLRLWPEQVYVVEQRLRLRLGSHNPVVLAYEAVRQRLVSAAEFQAKPDEAPHEEAVRAFETARDDFLSVALTQLEKPIPDKEPG